MRSVFRSIACKKAPTPGAEQETEVIPTAGVVHGINGDVVSEEAGNETDGCDEAVQQPRKKAVLLPCEAISHGFCIGARGDEKACRRGGDQ